MVDRVARDWMRERLTLILAGELESRTFAAGRSPKTKDRSVKRLLDELRAEIVLQFPLRPGDDLSELHRALRARIARTVQFLETDLEFRDLDAEWNWLGVFLVGSLATGLSLMVLHFVIEDAMGLRPAGWLQTLPFACLATVIAVHAIRYYLDLAIVATAIFRVRVLGHDLDLDDPDDFWPFATREQVDSALKART